MKTKVKKHLVIDMRMLEMSGIGRYIKEIVGRIAKLNVFKITFLCYKKDIDKILEYNGLDINFIEINSKIFSITEQFEIAIKCPQCDVYWSPQYNYPILVKLKCKHVLTTIHDCYQWAHVESLNLLHYIYIKFYSMLLKFPFITVITVSNFSKSEIIKHINIKDTKITVIYNGAGLVDSSKFTKQNFTKNGILAVGNIKPHKNILCLLKAFSALNLDIQEKNPLYIIGKKDGFVSPDSSVNFEINYYSPFVKYIGEVSDADLINYYRSSRYFVFPSLYEGFGLPGLEAISNGCSLICSDIPAFREIYGKHATYFNPFTHVDLHQILANLSSLNSTMESFDYSIYNWDISARKHAAIIQSLQ